MINRYKNIFIYSWIICALLQYNCSAATFNIDQSVSFALSNNISILLASADIKTKKAELTYIIEDNNWKANGKLDSTVHNLKNSLTTDENNINKVLLSTQFTKSFGNNLLMQYKLQQKLYDIEGAVLTYKDKQNNLVYTVKNNYFYLCSLNKILETKKAQLVVLNRSVDYVKQKFNLGMYSESNMKWLLAKTAIIKADIVNTKQKISDTTLKLQMLLGLDMEMPLYIQCDHPDNQDNSITTTNIDSIFSAITNNLTVRLKDINIKQNENDIKFTQKNSSDFYSWIGFQYYKGDIFIDNRIDTQQQYSWQNSLTHRINANNNYDGNNLALTFGIQKDLTPSTKYQLDIFDVYVSQNKLYRELTLKEIKQQIKSDYLQINALSENIKESILIEKELFPLVKNEDIPVSAPWYVYQELINNKLDYFDKIVSRIWMEYNFSVTKAHLDYLIKGSEL